MAETTEVVSPVAFISKPELTISPASINATPVELDSTTAWPDKRRAEKRLSREDLLNDMSTDDVEVNSLDQFLSLVEHFKD